MKTEAGVKDERMHISLSPWIGAIVGKSRYHRDTIGEAVVSLGAQVRSEAGGMR